MCTRRLLPLVCVALYACADHPTSPPIPARIVVVSGDTQSASVGAQLPLPITLRVEDASGRGLAGQSLNFHLSSGGAVEPASGTSGSGGLLQVRWTLGDTAGAQRADALLVDASGATLLSLTVRATALAGPAGALSAVAGDQQSGVVGSVLPQPLTVGVLDSRGNPVPGVTVQWAVSTGAGSVSPTALVTDSAGLALVSWRLGPGAGPQSVTASVASVSPVTFTATASAGAAAAVTLSLDSASLHVGEAIQLSAAVRDAFGNPALEPLTWASTQPGVAVVSANGLVVGAAVGAAAIVASAGSAADTARVSILPQPPIEWWGDNTSATNAQAFVGVRTRSAGGEVIASLYDASGATVRGISLVPTLGFGGPGQTDPTCGWSGAPLCWSSAMFLTGLPKGSYTLWVSWSSVADARISRTITKLVDPFVRVAIWLANPPWMFTGGTMQAGVRVENEGGVILPTPPVTFSSSDTAVATVSASGLVTGVAPGFAIISAAALGATGVDTVEVREGSSIPASLAIDGGNNLTGPAGQALPGYPTVIVRNAAGQGLPGVTVTWAVTGGTGRIGIDEGVGVTDWQGKASVMWIAGLGTNTLTATVAGLPPVIFTATGT